MLTAPAQTSTRFGSKRILSRRGAAEGYRRGRGFKRRGLLGAWRSLLGGVAKPDVPPAAPSAGSVSSCGSSAPGLAAPHFALFALSAAKVRQSRPHSSATMSKLARLEREEIMECQVMWEPDSKKDTQMDRFRAAVGTACGLALGKCGARARLVHPPHLPCHGPSRKLLPLGRTALGGSLLAVGISLY